MSSVPKAETGGENRSPKGIRFDLGPVVYLLLTLIGLAFYWFAIWTVSNTTQSNLIVAELLSSRPVSSGAIAHVTFRIKNSSDALVLVDSVEASCGCVRVNDVPLTIKSRGAALLRVSVDTEGQSGFWDFSLHGYSRSAAQPLFVANGTILALPMNASGVWGETTKELQ